MLGPENLYSRNGDALSEIEHCLNQLFADPSLSESTFAAVDLYYEELIGALLAAKAEIVMLRTDLSGDDE